MAQISMALAYLLSSALQKLISGPILELAGVTKLVSRDKNYSVRAVQETNDELGDLVAGSQLAITSAADGAIAAIEINKSLLPPARRV